MTADLKDQIHILMERGVLPVSAAEAASQARGRSARPARGSVSRGRILVAAGVAAACAAALIAAQLGGKHAGGTPAAGRRPAVVTAAYVRHLVSASRIALARAGRAVIVTRQTQGGVSQGTDTDEITFSGGNWNDSFSAVLPAAGGQPATTQSAINRVVDGQAYDHFVASHGLAWYHLVGPNAVASMAIPDPRKLLGELSPEAGFVVAGYATVDGLRLEHLRATRLRGLHSIQLGSSTVRGLTSLDIWVDGSGVVHRLSLTESQAITVIELNPPGAGRHLRIRPAISPARTASIRRLIERESKSKKLIMIKLAAGGKSRVTQQAQVTSVVVIFLDIGQPQVIGVPAHAYLSRGLG
jgi:hypothetical protein